MVKFRTKHGCFQRMETRIFSNHSDIDSVVAIEVTAADGYMDLEKVREKYPAFCHTIEDQVYFGDIAKMILMNCFL